MSDLTLEQQKAIALASARLRLQQSNEPPPIAGGVDPTSDMSGLEKFTAGAGKALSDTGLGTRQLASYAGIGDKEALAQEAQERKSLDRPLMNTGAGFAGDVAGNLALALAPGGAVKAAGAALKSPAMMTAGSSLLSPTTIRGGAALGGTFGAVQPAENVGERIANTGLGGMTGGIVPAAIHAGRAVKATVEPMYEQGQAQILGRLLRSSAGEHADDALTAMKNATELVPGSVPTAGQVAGSPGIAALERAAAGANPEEYARRFASQNEARRALLDELSGTSGARDFHAASRETTANQLYDTAYKGGIRETDLTSGVKGEITKLLKRPSIQSALKDAQQLAREEGKRIPKGDLATGSVEGLHYVKKALDNQLSKPGLGNEERRLISATRDRFLTLIDRLSPDYAAARSEYAAMSRPINQMDIAQEISSKAVDPLTGNIRPQAFARALSDDTAARATGFRGSTLENVMEPQQLQQLNAIKDDLGRSVFARDAGRGPGSNTFQNLAQENLMQQAGVSNLPQLLSRPVQLANYGLRTVYGAANRDMQKKLAEALLNPKEAAAMMQAASPQERAFLIQALRGLTPVGVATPGLVNANQ